jgi:hypothetical protein
MCPELLDARAFEYRMTDADHAGPDVAHRHLWGVGAHASDRRDGEQQSNEQAANRHGDSNSIIREKSLLVKEKWAIVAGKALTRNDRFDIVQPPVVGQAPVRLDRASAPSAGLARFAYWWYWSASEGASALA